MYSHTYTTRAAFLCAPAPALFVSILLHLGLATGAALATAFAAAAPATAQDDPSRGSQGGGCGRGNTQSEHAMLLPLSDRMHVVLSAWRSWRWAVTTVGTTV